jgi:hypothetical protein
MNKGSQRVYNVVDDMASTGTPTELATSYELNRLYTRVQNVVDDVWAACVVPCQP